MHITRLEIVDFKRIEAAAIDATTGKPIILTGDNGQGKTSILDAVMFALTRTGTEKPIRNGAESATVALTLTDGSSKTFTVRRKMKGANAYLDVTTEDGAKMPSPQKFLDAMIGNLAFDPEAFTRLKPKEQSEALRKAVGLDTSDLDDAYKTAFTMRTEANRTKDSAEKVFKACPVVAQQPQQPKDAAALVASRDALQGDLSTLQAAKECCEKAEQNIVDCEMKIAQLEEQLATVKDAIARHGQALKAASEEYTEQAEITKDHATKIDALNAELTGINEHNAAVNEHNRAIADRKTKNEAYLTALKRSTELDEEVKRIKSEKESRIAAANFPIPGLAIEEDIVLVNDVPFSDLNTAERIKVSTMIAMSQNPELKVIFVREGALVSRANIALLGDLAAKHGMQVWIEQFSEQPHEDSIHITDGMISHLNGEPSPAQQLELV